jgi:hypothetical protein
MAKKTMKALVAITKPSMEKAVAEATAKVKTLRVRSEADFIEAGAFLVACVETKKMINAYYKPKEDEVKAAKKKIADERAEYDIALKAAEKAARTEIEAYNAKKKAAATKAIEKAEAKSEATGRYVAPAIKEAPKVKGISFTERWDFAIEDEKKFIQWVMKDYDNRGHYLTIDDVSVRATVNDLKKEGEILPGIIASKYESSNVRTGR